MAVYVDITKKMDGFSLEVAFQSNAKRIGILGASGCGKSMTLKSIAGIETPEKGRIQIGDRVLFDADKKINIKPQKRGAGYLFQNYALFPTMTVEQNIGAGLRGNGRKKQNRVRQMIETFGLSGLEGRLPGELSGGQQQRTAIARALANTPAMILADEPTGNLDSKTTAEVMGLLKNSAKKYNQTIIMVTHNEILANSSDRIIRIEDGVLWEEGEQAC